MTGPGAERAPSLDGFRGCAALAVIAMHILDWGPGILGVDAFFALSGYLIGGILMDQAGAPDRARRFFVRRVLRIWPLYFVTTLLVALVDDGRRSLVPLLTMTSNFFVARQTLGHRFFVGTHLWSVCVEEHAYLLIPWIIWHVPRRRLGLALGLLALMSVAIRLFVLRGTGNGYTWTPARLDGIALGALAAWIARDRPAWIPRLALPAVFVAGMALESGAAWWSHEEWLDCLEQSLPAAGFAGIVLALGAGPVPLLTPLLSRRELRFFGDISYGLYMLHPIVWQMMAHRYSGVVPFVGVLAVTTILAYVSWRWFERPILQLSRPARAPALADARLGDAAPAPPR